MPLTSLVFGFSMDKQKKPIPFEQPLPINTQPKRLALEVIFTIGVKKMAQCGVESGSKGELGMVKKNPWANPKLYTPL